MIPSARAAKALIVVDLQNDFFPGGPVGIRGADEIVPSINRLQQLFEIVVAGIDWHPPEHGSFAQNHPGASVGDVVTLDGISQVLWPVHCVQNSPGAGFVPGLKTGRFERVFQKGTDPLIDGYSAFFDNTRRKATGLKDYLQARKATEVYVVGLTMDVCVKYTAIDAVDLGFRTFILEDACRGNSGGIPLAKEELRAAGVKIVQSY